MRPDCRPECFRPPLLEYGDHGRRDIVDGTRSIDRDDRTRLWVTALPCTISEPLESCGDPVVKVIVGGFDPIPRSATVGPRQCRGDRQLQEYRKIGHEPASRKPVRGRDLGIREATTLDLVCIGRQEESVRDDHEALVERWPNVLFDQFRTRRHKQERFSPRRQLGARLEENVSNLVPDGRSPRFANAEKSDPARGERLAEPPDLGRFADPFRALEYDQLTALRRHPSVMIELVAPFRMPSVIQLFTWSIVLSKFSCTEIARW